VLASGFAEVNVGIEQPGQADQQRASAGRPQAKKESRSALSRSPRKTRREAGSWEIDVDLLPIIIRTPDRL